MVSRLCTSPRLSLLPLLALLATGGRAPGERIGFSPEPETQVTRTYGEETAWFLETIEMTEDGSSIINDLPEVRGTSVRRVVVTDELLDCEDGRIRELRRAFDEIEATADLEVEGGGESAEFRTECASELEGTTVRFLWDEDDEAYERKPVDGSSSDSDLLEGLEFEMDLTELLPPDEVEAGDEWALDVELLSRLLVPAGELGLLPEESTPGGLFSVPTPLILAASLCSIGDATGPLSGEATARYLGAGAEDETGTVVIEIELEVSSEADHSERLSRYLREVDFPDDEVELEIELEIEATAQLVWDVEAGRAVSLELEGEIVASAHLTWNEELFDTVAEMEGTFEVAGTTRLAVVFEE